MRTAIYLIAFAIRSNWHGGDEDEFSNDATPFWGVMLLLLFAMDCIELFIK